MNSLLPSCFRKFSVVCAGIAMGAAGDLTAGVTLHYWDGGSPTDSYWDNYLNWFGDVPGGLSDRVIFNTGAARKVNTNNLSAETFFESINILEGGYNIHGNSVRMGRLF